MGFLTTITIHNDGLGQWEENPEALGKAILAGIEKANMKNKKVSTSNLIIQPSRHADNHAVYFHGGNTVRAIGQFESNFNEVAERFPEVAMKEAQEALRISKEAIDFLKKKARKKKPK